MHLLALFLIFKNEQIINRFLREYQTKAKYLVFLHLHAWCLRLLELQLIGIYSSEWNYWEFILDGSFKKI